MASGNIASAHGATSMRKIAAPPSDIYHCGGQLEATIWELWRTRGLSYLSETLIQRRLIENHDTYGLYDAQLIFRNLFAMARRCGRMEILISLADILLPIFSAQERLPDMPHYRTWICKGGKVCNDRNKLINREVLLVNTQALAFATTLALELAIATKPQANTHSFIQKSLRSAIEHLYRWDRETEIRRWKRATIATPGDVHDGTTHLLFTDRDLWKIVIYVNVARLFSIGSLTEYTDISPEVKDFVPEQNLGILLDFFKSRIKISSNLTRLGNNTLTAEIDSGFWAQHADTRYGAITTADPPLSCPTETVVKRNGQRIKKNTEKLEDIRTASTTNRISDATRQIGWDIGHARRLVSVLHTLTTPLRGEANTKLGKIINHTDWNTTARAFAAQLASNIWNGSVRSPLFTNYWSGLNGWYRVAYKSGTNNCNEGIRPFGLSEAFPIGGYAEWGSYYPLIGTVARTLYATTLSSTARDRDFVIENYPRLSEVASPATRELHQLMFWPTLVYESTK